MLFTFFTKCAALHFVNHASFVEPVPVMQEVKTVTGSSEEPFDVSSSVNTRAAPADLQTAAALISQHVNQLIPRVYNSLAADNR